MLRMRSAVLDRRGLSTHIQAGMFFVVPLFLSVALGLRFVSDADLERALDDAGIEGEQGQAIVDENEEAPDPGAAGQPGGARDRGPDRALPDPPDPRRAGRRFEHGPGAGRGRRLTLTRPDPPTRPMSSAPSRCLHFRTVASDWSHGGHRAERRPA